MALRYFLSKSLMLIYERHKKIDKQILVIYEDTKGKTKYKCCRSTTDKELSYNGNNYYIISIQRFFINGYHIEDNIRNVIMPKILHKNDYLIIIVNKLLELFN